MTCEKIFPELRESEDKKWRNWLIGHLKGYINQTDNKYAEVCKKAISWLEKQGEQNPTDKVEPKFKVGDWVVYNRNDSSREILYVYDIRDSRYYFNDNIHFSWSVKECDEKSHFWTIQDAEGGDVLATKKGNPFIYDKDRYNNGLAYYYAGLDVNKELTLKSPHHMLAHFGELHSVSPATKEQRDLLFQKMKEAGYEWDAEKKELRKIEQNSTWSKEDERIYNEIIDFFLGDIETRCATIDKQRHFGYWLKSIKPQKRWKPSEQNIKDLEWCADLVKDKMGVGFHRLQVFIDEIKNL